RPPAGPGPPEPGRRGRPRPDLRPPAGPGQPGPGAVPLRVQAVPAPVLRGQRVGSGGLHELHGWRRLVPEPPATVRRAAPTDPGLRPALPGSAVMAVRGVSKKTLAKVVVFAAVSILFSFGLAMRIGNLHPFSHSYKLTAQL